MSESFEHSIKVPRLYKTVAKIVQTVREDGASLKQLVYLKQHPNIKGVYALALTTLQHGSQLDQLIRRTLILVNEPRLDPWLSRVLITELLWGKQKLQSDCKPVKTILGYEKSLREELRNTISWEPRSKWKVDKPRYVRINTLLISIDEAIASFEDEGWRLTRTANTYVAYIQDVSNLTGNSFIQDMHIPEMLVFPPKTQFYNHPSYTSGSIVLQDKASCLPAYLLDAKPGSVVLDMCAAPGMKTTHLAAMLENRGKIYATEIDQRRYQMLCEIVASTNSMCVETINVDVMTVDDVRCPDVEYILVDPSCSGSGMLDRVDVGNSDAKCAPERLKNLQAFQVLILRHALLDFPNVKRVVYSTCSIHPEENEQVVDEVLTQIGEAYELIPAKQLMDDNWINYSSMDYKCEDKCVYAKPETDFSNGFFIAVFERNFQVPLPTSTRKKRKLELDEQNLEVEKKSMETNNEDSIERDETKSDADSTSRRKKKKKKCKKSHDDVSEPDCTVNVEREITGEKKVNKSKKSKKSKANGVEDAFDLRPELEVQDEPSTDVEPRRKKKNKK